MRGSKLGLRVQAGRITVTHVIHIDYDDIRLDRENRRGANQIEEQQTEHAQAIDFSADSISFFDAFTPGIGLSLCPSHSIARMPR